MEEENKVINLNEPTINFDFFHCIEREGFIFTVVTNPANVLDAIVIKNPCDCDWRRPIKSSSHKSLEEHVDFINKYKLEKAFVIAEDINFINRCPSLKYLAICPEKPADRDFDYSPLYEMPCIKYLDCTTTYGIDKIPISNPIDYSKINGLSELWMDGQGHLNYEKVETLESIHIKNTAFIGFEHFEHKEKMKEISLLLTNARSLDGISGFKNLKKLTLEYNRVLGIISELNLLSDSLKSLYIENCPKITDFSCLYELKNLEQLGLMGSNKLADLNFLKEMKKLKAFVFSFDVASCDLSPCLSVPYVYSEKNKKKYNLKDKDLPKNYDGGPIDW